MLRVYGTKRYRVYAVLPNDRYKDNLNGSLPSRPYHQIVTKQHRQPAARKIQASKLRKLSTFYDGKTGI